MRQMAEGFYRYDPTLGVVATPFQYDPQRLWVYAPGTCFHIFESHEIARGHQAIHHPEACDEAPEGIERSPLQKVAPVLLDLCRRIPSGVLSPDLDAEMRRAAEYAGKTEHLEDIVAVTREWWSAGPPW